LDGIWTTKRVLLSIAGLAVGIFIYFFSKHFVLIPAAAGEGKWLLASMQWLDGGRLLTPLHFAATVLLPVGWLFLLAAMLMDRNRRTHGDVRRFPIPRAGTLLIVGALLYAFSLIAPSIFTFSSTAAGPGPYYVPGLAWIYHIVPTYFANAYGLYYLLYFSAIAVFGLYWAWRSGHRRIWRRNLTIIVTQWTLWWGIPTFLVVFLGRNPWTPLIARSLNAWPLNMVAFRLDPVAGPGDPAWWNTVAVVGVVWATLLTFVIIPVMTIGWGKIYCSYFCSCGALAETVGNGFRHRGPKGDWPRRLERFGFVFIPLAAIATIADLLGCTGPLGLYNLYVGTFLAGAVAIGLYPFLGQRVWCRMWCPLAFWMNFWGRWSDFRITPEKGKCIDCNVCNQYCQMGIDIKSRALRGIPVTLKDTPCVACAECVVRCPMQILHLGSQRQSTPHLHTIALSAETSEAPVPGDPTTQTIVAQNQPAEEDNSPGTTERVSP
ncbi:MAG: 4Fe-4S binding protein, partial [Pirellulales bacterium]